MSVIVVSTLADGNTVAITFPSEKEASAYISLSISEDNKHLFWEEPS